MSPRTKLGIRSQSRGGATGELDEAKNGGAGRETQQDKAQAGDQIAAEPFAYPSLQQGALSIRLLKLLPGDRAVDKIAYQLYETSLEKADSYEALSYVWNDKNCRVANCKECGTVPTQVRINDGSLMIGCNLHWALRSLRHMDKDRILAHEKYTPIIFPMPEDLARAALDRMRKNQAFDDQGVDEMEQDRRGALNNIPHDMIENLDVDDPLVAKYRIEMSISSIGHLLGALWWYRAWTLQEILLAKDALVVVGRHSIGWWRLCLAVNHGINIGIWAPILSGILIDGMLLSCMLAQRLQERRIRQPAGGMNVAQEMLELLTSSRLRDATNPRDKIYALMGLLGAEVQTYLRLLPDYSLAVANVYTQSARELIRVSGTLDVLGSAGIIAGHVADPELPSWVPDWKYTKMVCMPLMQDALGQRRATNATTDITASDSLADADVATFVDDGVELVISGYEVTAITAVAPRLVAPIMRRFFQRTDEFNERIADIERKSDSKNGNNTFQRILDTGSAIIEAANLAFDMLTDIVPHLNTYLDWETFATDTKPTNLEPANIAGAKGPYDPHSTYWRTICVGTYVSASTIASREDLSLAAPSRSATRDLFYLWRATLKPIRNLHRWRHERMFRLLAWIGYMRKTRKNYCGFVRLLEGAYERRLVRGENGYLCLAPRSAEVGDKIVLARGGRVPLVLRKGEGGGWGLVGEAYVHGIMDGEAWDEGRAGPMRIR
ncbi:hypothetical protein B0T16DRAFT_493819 [Cercophora newfieldiana]|uniref:Heterokaryon incompatibility domain-containing protein n=1 Tax=Cercophora newfieldiana TaxID=92897 RepID=A0AA39Y6H4_9PEZI|nr:hypothetical protein B0T16DRAFT_493819 [Cercophora newfieldiana]